MTGDPFRRFLGIDESSDPMALLGLTPETCTVPRIEEALRDRIARVFRHPDGRGEEAEFVCRRIRAAADLLRDPVRRRQAVARTSGDRPHAGGIGPRVIHLTPFDRHALTVLVACGGWNANSRTRLVALASTYGVTARGLITVVTRLSEHASSGGHRLAVSDITSGAARVERVPQRQTPGISLPVARLTAMTDPETSQRSWPTFKLSVLFGVLTIVACVVAVRALFRMEDPVEPAVIDTTPLRPPPEVNPIRTGPGDGGSETPRPRLAEFDPLPGFDAPPLDAGMIEAADRGPGLAGELGLVMRKLEVTDGPSAAVYRSWDIAVRDAATAWLLMDSGVRATVDKALVDVLHAAESPEVADRLLDSLLPPSGRPAEPNDIVRGAWMAGTLGHLVAEPGLPPAITSRAATLLDVAIEGGRPSEDAGFAASAGAWLGAVVPHLVASLEYDDNPYEFWQRWLEALGGAGLDRSALDEVVLQAVTRILRTGTDLSRPGPSVNVVARLLDVAEFERDRTAADRALDWFADDSIDAHDLWVVTSLLARLDTAPWFDDALVVPAEADMARRRRARDRIRQVVNDRRRRAADASPATGRGLPVNPDSARRWSSLLDTALGLAPAPSHQARMRALVTATRLNEVAALLAARRDAEADRLLDEIERAVSGAPVDRAPAVGVLPGGGAGTTRGTAGRIGQAVGRDGEWAAAYEAAGRDVEARLELLRSLGASAGTDLGPIDADQLVREAYRGSPQDVRASARGVVSSLFAQGPNVAMELLDQMPGAPSNASLSDFLSHVVDRVLPSIRSEAWENDIRLALVEHAVGLRRTQQQVVDDNAAELAAVYASRLRIMNNDRAAGAGLPGPGAAAATLVDGWRQRASGLVVSDPVPADLESLRRRDGTRMRLVEGPIQQFVAWQVALVEVLAYVAAAERPAIRDRAVDLLASCAAARAAAEHVLDQASETELAMAQIWRLRMTLDEEVTQRGTTGSSFPVWVAAVLTRPGTAAEERWSGRLHALDPGRPMGYFELAEEIGDSATDEETRALARRLFALAGALDRERLGRSACLALADLTDNDHARRRLAALASLLPGTGSAWDLDDRRVSASAPSVMAVCDALSHYRRGEGNRALGALRREDAMTLLEAHADVLRGGMQRFIEDCKLYRSRLRPTLSAPQVDHMLFLAAALLAGDDRSWAADLILSGGVPLVEVDPDRLDDAFDVSVERPIYRDGRWIEAAADGVRSR